MAIVESQVSPAAGQRVKARRAEAEQILAFTEHLSRRDRLILEQVYKDGRAIADVARLMRVNARTLQHHVAKTLKHINSSHFQFLAGKISLLPKDLHPVARRAFLEARSIRETSRMTRRSIHQVRADRTRIQAFIQSHEMHLATPPRSSALFN